MKNSLQLSVWGALLALLLLPGCMLKPQVGGAPGWIMNPGHGVVASCGFNVRGRYAQEQCAYMRARERLAAEQGVTISSVAHLSESVRNDRSNVQFNKETLEKVSEKDVKARVKDTWYDAQRDEFYVWMVTER